jgi:transglutaminase-like putative cysteine protease
VSGIAAPAPRIARDAQPGRTGVDYGPWLRLLAFAGLAGLGAGYWASFVAHAPSGRVAGVLLIAVALGATLIALGRVPLPPRAVHAAAAVATLVALCFGLVAIGLDASMLKPARWDDFGGVISRGFEGLSTVAWPYDGPDPMVRLTILLAIPPVLVAAAAFAFWPVRKRPGFDSVGLVLLIAFYAVAITDQAFGAALGRGLVLLVLIAAWVWLPHLGRRGALSGAVAIAAAGLFALPVAAALDAKEPWVDYTKWGIGSQHRTEATFEWNHRYGTINWPRSGRTLLAVRSKDPHYWKAETLDHFDGLRWFHTRDRTPFGAELPAPLNPAWTQEISFTVLELRSDLVIGAGTILRTDGNNLGVSIASGDGTVRLVDHPLEQGDSYTVRAYVPDPTADAMRQAAATSSVPTNDYLRKYVAFALPGKGQTALNTKPADQRHRFVNETTVSLPFREERYDRFERADVRRIRRSPYKRTYALARRLAAGQATTYDVVRNTERWLQRTLSYSERVPTRAYPLEGFLFKDKLGYCQQFSGAMALMLRMNGIPARVAAGFAPGVYDQANKEFRVRDLDAHSWVEVYFQGIGWVPFDPTPTAAPAGSQSGIGNLASAAHGGNDRAAAEGGRQSRGSASAGSSAGGGGGSSAAWWIVPVGLLTLAFLSLGGLWVYAVVHERRHRRATPADAQLAELSSALRRMGHDLPPRMTLAALERRLRRYVGPASARYAGLVGAHRYAPPDAPAAAGPRRADRAALRRELASAGGPLGRIRAFFALPPRPNG